MKIRPSSDRHQITVVHAGITAVHRVDLEPGWTVWYTPAAAAGSVGGFMVYADDTGMVYADDTAMEYAAA